MTQQVVTIDTKTTNDLIKAILSLKLEVASLREKIEVFEDIYEKSTSVALNEVKLGDFVEFSDINKAIKYLRT